jgi:hypothetical protein
MRIEHKNSLQDYLGGWLAAMDVKARAEGKPSSGLRVPQPLQSLIRHENSLCLMLELFDERLTRFERSLGGEKADCDYGAYSEAMTFLDAIYLFSRMLLDSAAGIVKHLHAYDTGRALPTGFNDMFKKSVRGELPDDLNTVFSSCAAWFPQLKDRRDDIVHHFETYFIGFTQRSESGATVMQFSPREETLATGSEDLRSYVGMVMAGYQGFIDRLLDYWDEVLRGRHGISVFRTSPICDGRRANILWWAYRYGGYRNDGLLIGKS